jgi:stage II sporulation protein AA (anti-sigma F factor antagonist)
MKEVSVEGLQIDVTHAGEDNKVTVVTPRGYIDTTTVDHLEQTLLELVSTNQFMLVVDLKYTEYINSSGWGVFLRDLKRIRENDGDLVLSNMHPDVQMIFETMEFSQIFKSYDSLEAACASFGP